MVDVREKELPPIHLTIIRHAPTLWNKEKRIQGAVDTNLDPDLLPEYIKDVRSQDIVQPDIIVVSGLRRSRQAADAITRAYEWRGIPVVTEPGLNERKWGALEGLTNEEAHAQLLKDQSLVARYPDLVSVEHPYQVWDREGFKVAGGESPEEVRERVEQTLKAIYRQFPGKNILMVSHAGVMISLGLDIHSPQSLTIEDKGK